MEVPNASSLALGFAGVALTASSALALDFNEGEINTPVELSSSALALDFTDSPTTNAAELPLNFSDLNDEINPPESPKRRMDGVLFCLSGGYNALSNVGDCYNVRYDSDKLQSCAQQKWTDGVAVMSCHRDSFDALPNLQHCSSSAYQEGIEIQLCSASESLETRGKQYCNASIYAETLNAQYCSANVSSNVDRKIYCTIGDYDATRSLTYCSSNNISATRELMRCQQSKYKTAIPVPCEWYPIELPSPPDPNDNICTIPPTTDQLPLNFDDWGIARASMLPLPFTCWDEAYNAPTPLLGAYIMHNTITCTIDGEAIDIINPKIATDMSAFCWQGSVTIAPKDFNQIDFEQDTPPLVEIDINGTKWRFYAEDVSDNRAFINDTYTISGRSITSLLSADYAQTKSGIVDTALYARQIADQALALSGYQIAAWQIPDWLVPADTYDTSNKTPLAIIAEIAQAAGGFVKSSKTEAKLYIKPRWPQPAWMINSANVDVVIPDSVIINISGREQTTARKNAVRLHGAAEGKLIYRENEDRSAEASVQSSALYTDDAPMIAAGKAILSDTGEHKIETIKLLWSPKYNVPLANLGEIWQVNERGKNWRGVVVGVDVSVEQNNDAPVVYQTVTIDRYKDV